MAAFRAGGYPAAMTASHPLDHAVWSALTGRQAHLAVVAGSARRFDPAYGVFAGVADRSPASLDSLGALVAAQGEVALAEPDPPRAVPGAVAVSRDAVVQMTARRLTPAPKAGVELIALAAADAPEMLALATLTKPGPFFARTPDLGDFYGVKIDGRLAAMAGERMKPDGHTEVSGVCTDPAYRGRGYAGALMRRVVDGILARGETPFLHAYAANLGAIALYESLGFEVRRAVEMARFRPA